MGTTEDVLRAAYEVANSRNEWATGIVTAGVVIELVALLLFGKEMSRNEKIALAIGSILVVLGVGGEWVFGSRASAIAVQIQQASDEKIATLAKDEGADHKIAAQAAADAAGLGVNVQNLHTFVNTQESHNNAAVTELQHSTAGLNKARDDALAAADGTKKDLAQMTALLAQESDLRAKIEKLTAPRQISEQQVAQMSVALKLFAGQQWEVIPYWDMKESLDLANRIYAALDKAKWVWKKQERWTGIMGVVAGVLVYSHPQASAKTRNAAAALVKALNDVGIACESRDENDPGHPNELISITVGQKP